MKAVIPVAGVGSRLKPHTHVVPKVLMHVAGKPILGHILDELQKLDIKDIIFVTGHMGEKIKEFVGSYTTLSAAYVEQKEPLGLGHAIYTASALFGNEPILIILGDTVFDADFRNAINRDQTCIGVKAVENPRRFGIVELNGKGKVKSLVEKDENPKSNLAIVGIYYITNPLLLKECLEEIVAKNMRSAGEFQLTDALNLMVKRGEEISTFEVKGWYDCGKPETVLATNRVLLEKYKESYSIPGNIVVPPVYIGKNVVLEHSCIGPYVSIGNDAQVVCSILRDSIINEGARVENELLENSIIGRDAVIIGKFNKINVGDSSEIDLGG